MARREAQLGLAVKLNALSPEERALQEKGVTVRRFADALRHALTLTPEFTKVLAKTYLRKVQFEGTHLDLLSSTGIIFKRGDLTYRVISKLNVDDSGVAHERLELHRQYPDGKKEVGDKAIVILEMVSKGGTYQDANIRIASNDLGVQESGPDELDPFQQALLELKRLRRKEYVPRGSQTGERSTTE